MMSRQVEFIPKIQVRILFFSLVTSMILLSSCGTEPKEETVEIEEVTPPTRLDVVTLDMDFQAVDTIPSGWVTWRYQNRSPQPHFILIDDPLDSITVVEFRDEFPLTVTEKLFKNALREEEIKKMKERGEFEYEFEG